MAVSLRVVVIGAGLVVLAPAAVAQCTDDRLQLIANRYMALGEASLKSGPIAQALGEDLVLCAGAPAAHKIGSMAYAAMSNRETADPEAALAYADLAVRHSMILDGFDTSLTATRYVANAQGAAVPILFNDSYEVSKAAVHALLASEIRAGRPAHISGPAKAGDPRMTCNISASSRVQQAAYWMKDKKIITPGGRAFIDRMLAPCKPDDYNGLSARGYRLEMLMSLADHAPTAPDALKLAFEAQADSDAIFAQRPEGLHIGWKSSDVPRLERVLAKVIAANGYTIPMSEWYAHAHLGKSTTAMVIAAQLDAAYARDMKVTGPNVFRAYRDILTPAFEAAKALPESQSRTARKMLHLAASKHAAGEWRRDENKALKAPAAYLYNWIDPDYAPATPAAAPSAQ